MEILKATRPRPEPHGPDREPAGSFIEDVEQWIRKYLRLADEVLENPSKPDDGKAA